MSRLSEEEIRSLPKGLPMKIGSFNLTVKAKHFNLSRTKSEDLGAFILGNSDGSAAREYRGGHHGYVGSVRSLGQRHFKEGQRKIVYDKFHIAKHLGEAVDKVRRKENRTLRAAVDDRLTEHATTGCEIRRPWNRPPSCAAADSKPHRHGF